ncbi:hypothetical protein FIBSPDRAFT_845031 [Athelia psychrophila]|uniref:Uncharacterized protein n=1 Tax=Athelia psychrophila TaxID=1759441 RepID=A0A167TX87_9AGAM|nr:hypothetical protein FIBSPDRAFT_845031 [Fibularhizoctonia sp. CBS 109695]
MFIPFLATPEPSRSARGLDRRKGGGGGGKGGGGSSGSGSKGGGSTGGGSSGSGSKSGGSTGGGGGTSSTSPKSIPITGRTPTGRGSASSYGGGGGKITTIPAGAAFAGRTVGGGTRDQVFGNSVYGSGYPGVVSRGVSGRGFPFFFWPVVWGGAAGGAAGAYLHATNEYGDCSNSSRPGGSMTQATFMSNSTGTTFYLLADNSTVAALITTIDANCTLSPLSSTAPTSHSCSDPNALQPEQAIQYYRASSVVLALSGYNNSAAYSSDENAAASALPSGIDMTLLNCLNQTIGVSVPLVNGAGPAWAGSGMGALGLFWMLWLLLGTVL